MKTVAIAQQKGGTGKTTTASALAAGLAKRGFKCLMIDLDAQCNLTYIHRGRTDGKTVLDLLEGSAVADDVIQTVGEGLDIIPASGYLAGADGRMENPATLKTKIEGLARIYDFAVIDTPPALGMITINAFMAANSVIIPCLADVFSIQATAAICRTIDTTRENVNNALKIDGLLLTRYNKRQIITRDTAEMLETTAHSMKTRVFASRIRDSVAVRESQTMQKDIFSYAPKSTAAQDYRFFLDELVKIWKIKNR